MEKIEVSATQLREWAEDVRSMLTALSHHREFRTEARIRRAITALRKVQTDIEALLPKDQVQT